MLYESVKCYEKLRAYSPNITYIYCEAGPKKDDDKKDQKWLDGLWYNPDNKTSYLIIKKENILLKSHTSIDYPDQKETMTGHISYGNFDEAKQEIYEASGIKSYNILQVYLASSGMEFKVYGVVNEAKNKIYIWGFANKMEVVNWMSNDEFEKVVKNGRDPYEAPSIPYFEPIPDKPGKLLWLSGKLCT